MQYTTETLKNIVVPYFSNAIIHTFLGARDIVMYEKKNGFSRTKKIHSEWLSNNFATYIKHYLEKHQNILDAINVFSGKSDNDSDMVFQFKENTDIKYHLEIKVTCSPVWRGGEFSQRECDHLFIFWEDHNDTIKVFACLADVSKNDWFSNIDRGYYAPTMHRYTLAQKQHRMDILGSISKYMEKNHRRYVDINYFLIQI